MKVSEVIQKVTGYGSRPKESESVETLVKLYKRQMIAKTVVMLLVLISVVIQLGFSKKPPSLTIPHVAIVKVHGAIGGENGVQGVDIIKAIKEAYESPTAKGIMLDLNSGGGSPVQAEMVYEYIMSLRDNGKPIKAIVQEGCMSACYYIASAAESITAHRSSVVGSIGVRMDLWDFSEVKDRYGVGKKTLSAGTHKTILDSWSDTTLSEARIELVSKNAMNPLYESFVNDVKLARSNLDEEAYPNIYQGMFYSASKAKEAGLIDNVESMYFFTQNFKKALEVDETRIYEQRKKSFFETLGFPSISVNLNLPSSVVTS